MYDLPLASLATEHGGNAQQVGLRWCPLDGRGRVLERQDVCEVTARAGSDDLVPVGGAVGEKCSELLEDRADLSPPFPFKAAPNRVTGSWWDHMAIRGPASPLWRAISASFSRGMVSVRKAATSVPITPLRYS